MTDRKLTPEVIFGLCVVAAVMVAVVAIVAPKLLGWLVGGAVVSVGLNAAGSKTVKAGRKRAAAGAADVSEANREAAEATKAAEARAEAVNDEAEAGDGNDRIRV